VKLVLLSVAGVGKGANDAMEEGAAPAALPGAPRKSGRAVLSPPTAWAKLLPTPTPTTNTAALTP